MNSSFSARKISSAAEWIRVYFLYRRAFPRSERKPFSMIVSMWKKGKTDIWCYAHGGRFAGFAATINGGELVLLDYLAIDQRLRGRGIGSSALRHLQGCYEGRGLFVEIESAFEPGPEYQQRIRRKRFYEGNGMRPSRVMASVFGVKMELLCRNCSVDFPTYNAFYREHYSPWAAQHIIEEEYPAQEQ